MPEHKMIIPIFVTEDTPRQGLYEVNFQFPRFCVTLTAADLSFARHIVDFVLETKGNPKYRDIPLGDGVYRHYTPHKCVDLSSSFRGTLVQLRKDGGSDDTYDITIAPSSDFRLSFPLWGKELEAFVESIREIIYDFCDTDECA